MCPFFNRLLIQSLLLTWLSVGVGLPAQSLDSLIERSPFFPEGYNPNPSNEQPEKEEEEPPGQWEFRGWITLGDQTRVSLFNKTNNTSQWADIDNSGNASFEILSFDASSRSLQIRADGRVQTLDLRENTFSATRPPPRTPPARPNSANNRRQVEEKEEDDPIVRRPVRRRVIVPRRRDNN
ncbi:MAG: hypothetical protein MK080_05585 [Opitutales bacterium]|nr:hypothetical protein [Opitutales bacterium]NRA27158.1 hypothetical protein [Opitutales bacterium]